MEPRILRGVSKDEATGPLSAFGKRATQGAFASDGLLLAITSAETAVAELPQLFLM